MDTQDRIIGVVIGLALLASGFAFGISNSDAYVWTCLLVMGTLFTFASILLPTGVRSAERLSTHRLVRSANPALFPVFIGAAALAAWYFDSLTPVLLIGLGYSLILWHAAAHDRGPSSPEISYLGDAGQATPTTTPNSRSHPLYDRDLD